VVLGAHVARAFPCAAQDHVIQAPIYLLPQELVVVGAPPPGGARPF
jgi:hypothetical protein